LVVKSQRNANLLDFFAATAIAGHDMELGMQENLPCGIAAATFVSLSEAEWTANETTAKTGITHRV
jgi:hypothetical protein